MLPACLVLLAALGDPPPRILQPVVNAIERGTQARLVISGKGLSRTQRVVFDDATGIAAVVMSRTATRVYLQLSTGTGVALGERELRLVTPNGTSNAVNFHITHLPVQGEREPNNHPATATAIATPALMCGTIHATAERDEFRFRGIPGERVVFDLYARRIGSALDPTLTVRDHVGNAIAWSHSTQAGDAVLSFDPPAAGDYVLVVRDVRYRGGRGYHYHLHAGGRPTVDAVFPLAGEHGRRTVVTLRDCGPRDDNRQTVELDLAKYRSGQERLELATPEGTLVRAGFAVTPYAAILETEPNDSREQSQEITFPIAVSGRIEHTKDVDIYRLKIARAITLRVAARARAFGSPLDPLLIVQDKTGKRLKIDDDSGDGSDARIDYKFKPGEYHILVRSLVDHGGLDHTYLLTVAPPTRPVPSFELRFRPDTPMVRRGSRTRLWCEVVRRGGFTGDVTLEFANLPQGVHIDPVRLTKGNAWTSVFTVHASMQARPGAVPLLPRATATIGGRKVTAASQPEAGADLRKRAWLTVADPAQFTVAPLGPPPASVRARWAEERAALERQLTEPDAELVDQITAFEVELAKADHWVAVQPDKMQSAQGSSFKKLPDGSILMTGITPQKDTYRFELTVDLAGVRAVRLDVLPDPSHPTGGLSRAPVHGNFVLNRFELAPRGGDPVRLLRPKARFSQDSYPVAASIDGSRTTGWAVDPEIQQPNWAIYEIETPLPAKAGKTTFTVLMDQQYGGTHVIGRFRLSVATSRLDPEGLVLPNDIHRIFRSSSQQRSTTDQKTLATWFRGKSPAFDRIRKRIAQIDAGRGNYREIAKLEGELRGGSKALTAARRRWEEATLQKLVPWTELAFTELRSEHGVRFEKDPANVIRVRGALAAKDDYTLVAGTDVQGITAIRLEVLPSKANKKGGSGLGATGNFVLTQIRLQSWSQDDPTAFQLVELHTPNASFEQARYPIRGTLDDDDTSGWGVFPKVNQVHYGLWRTRTPIQYPGRIMLRFYLEHQSPHVRHQLGNFRISVTNAKKPTLSERGLPLDVARALTTPEPRRSKTQRRRLREWHRRIAPETRARREQIQSLRAQQSVYPPVLSRSKSSNLAVRVERRAGFIGAVTLSLEGYTSGRERNRQPRAFTKSFVAKPVTLGRGFGTAVLEFKALPNCALGTRAVVIRAETKIGKDVIVEYSEPILFTVR